MPDLDGWSVLAALRQDSELADIPVIMVTILDEQRRAVALGAADRSIRFRAERRVSPAVRPSATCFGTRAFVAQQPAPVDQDRNAQTQQPTGTLFNVSNRLGHIIIDDLRFFGHILREADCAGYIRDRARIRIQFDCSPIAGRRKILRLQSRRRGDWTVYSDVTRSIDREDAAVAAPEFVLELIGPGTRPTIQGDVSVNSVNALEAGSEH